MLRSNESQYQSDITITQGRYNELLIAEKEAEMLKGIIRKRIKLYGEIGRLELCLISDLLNMSEDSEEV